MDEHYLDQHALSLVAGANMASPIEIKKAIQRIKLTVGTGYYDDNDGDILLTQIAEYLQKKLNSL
jgi:hypothetical protein